MDDASSKWTDAELLMVLRLRDEGVTYAGICRAMGRSRSAVAGILRRLNAEYAASEAA